jgi:hypothetical protein
VTAPQPSRAVWPRCDRDHACKRADARAVPAMPRAPRRGRSNERASGLPARRWRQSSGYSGVAKGVPRPSQSVTRRGRDPASRSARCASFIALLSASSPRRTPIPRTSRAPARRQLADAWDRHQPAAGRRGPCHASHVSVDRSDRRHQGGPPRNETTHGGGEISDPLACLKSVVDEGGGERARQSDPEHDRETTDLIFEGHSLAH